MWLAISICSAILAVIILMSIHLSRQSLLAQLRLLEGKLSTQNHDQERIQSLLMQQQEIQGRTREAFDAHQIQSLKTIQESLHTAANELRQQVGNTLTQNAESLNKHIDKLTEQTRGQLQDISKQVDKQLATGFEKTTATFNDITKRLIIIDQAQQKITELSSNVVSLQEILSDKKSRGAFGEVQLSALIRNMIPEHHFSLQHTLSNAKRCDCILFLPEPTGNIVIDAKFPLESYQAMIGSETTNPTIETQFKKDIKKHIQDIADKYIIPGETADGAMMFIPAEAIFAEIHGRFTDLVEFAQQRRIWLVSPTTMMAILTTARAVLKDAATRAQVHIIQEHLMALGKDFDRFQKRMDNLARHINQANEDVDLVYKSSKKISSRFSKIEKAELGENPADTILPEDVG
jgi:DNA recombination protein RmuC